MVLYIVSFFILGAIGRAETAITYQGTDQGRPCFLFVHSEIENDSSYQVEVSTSYEHSGQGLGKVILSFDPSSQGKILNWENTQTKEFLKVLLKNPSQTFKEPNAFRLKWVHFDHLHDATCSDLKWVGGE